MDAALKHEVAVAQITAATARRLALLWRGVSTADIDASWGERSAEAFRTIADGQYRAAVEGSVSSAFQLAAQGDWVTPDGFPDPAGFAGIASSGAPLTALVARPPVYAKQLIGGGMQAAEALRRAGILLNGIGQTQIRDAARGAAGVDIASRRGVGYVRQVGPGACSRCLILAGRFYRWNQGFLRHPRCNCVHIATTAKSLDAARSEGLIDDPYEAFNSLSEAEQNRRFGAANAQAIRDGSDIFQVVNARRGAVGITTPAGTSRGAAAGVRTRLTPEGIYRQARSREEALRLLEANRYILPGGQVPTGVLRGQREGYGALGRGGTRVGARAAIEQARLTGVRDPASRYTMTAAELRLDTARLRYEAVLEGRNPFNKNKPLTPDISAEVEAEYKRFLASGGNIFTE